MHLSGENCPVELFFGKKTWEYVVYVRDYGPKSPKTYYKEQVN